MPVTKGGGGGGGDDGGGDCEGTGYPPHAGFRSLPNIIKDFLLIPRVDNFSSLTIFSN